MLVERLCQNPRCGLPFSTPEYTVKIGQGKYCSRACYWDDTHPIAVVCQNPLCKKPFSVTVFNQDRGRGVYCSQPCYQAAKVRPVAFRFWERVERCNHEYLCIFCCWEFDGSKSKKGYGRFRVNHELGTVIAHRFAWFLFQNRPLSDNAWVLHHCDNPPCANPLHLYTGTPKQNTQDSIKRGRFKDNLHTLSTSEHPGGNRKVTHTDIPVIRQAYQDGQSLISLAEKHNVHPSTIKAIVHYRTWKEIP